MTVAWDAVARRIRSIAADDAVALDAAQRRSLRWIAARLPSHGVVVADEVGTGKTRIACAVMRAVFECGGRTAVAVPAGLIHQWTAEAFVISPEGPAPKVLRTFRQFLDGTSRATSDGDDRHPDPRAAEWWLISHTFQVPQVRSATYWWRMSLPSLVRARLAERDPGTDDEPAVQRLREVLQRAEQESWEGWWRAWPVLLEVADRVVARMSAADRRAMRAHLSGLPVVSLRSSATNAEVVSSFQHDGGHAGRAAAERILGRWLGSFDLVVIDEAHKSRGDFDPTDEEEARPRRDRSPVLARLVDGILGGGGETRRLCLTATPMELSLSQWQDLLRRARCGLGDDMGAKAAQDLHSAAESAIVAPDEAARLQALCAAAGTFQRTMAPFVTRRRRDEEPLVGQFRDAVRAAPALPHPHRRVRRVTVALADMADDGWRDVLFAAEALSRAVCGLPSSVTRTWPEALRSAYTRVAAGHVTADLTGEEVALVDPAAEGTDPAVRAKVARVAWWQRRLREARRRVVERGAGAGPSFDPDTEHPRVVAAVREVEAWTEAGEKVLVFGVFLGPLHRLRDVLNVRQALRALDRGQPLAHALAGDARLLAIALRQWERMRAEGALRGDLGRTAPDLERLRAGLAEAQGDYERLRERVRRRADPVVKAWRQRPDLLAEVNDALVEAITAHFVAFVVDDLLARGRGTRTPPREEIEHLAEEFVGHRIDPLLRDIDADDASEEAVASMRERLLQRAFGDDHELRQSTHCRLLEGSTRLETRHHLQAAFNRAASPPRVLLAQSQVGREGLNLHGACRVVLQFHAEWNPAVLEQQIGRVDRKGSDWERRAQRWLDGGARGEAPYVEVRQLVCEGTYDAYQWERVGGRQRVFDASLFGALLPADAWERVPREWVTRLREAAPSFSP
jgi:hypothetical protein